MDGTLTFHVHDFALIRAQLGIAVDQPILEAISRMPEAEAKLATAKLHKIEMTLAGQARVRPHVVELLQLLQDRGCFLGILTRNSEAIAEVTLATCGLSRFFDSQSIIGRETCIPKPDPDGINHLLRRWQVKQTAAVIVGDYLYDIEAGHRAGITTVHFDQSRTFSWPQYMNHGIACLSELRKLIL